MKNINILIVEDSKVESDALVKVLSANGFTVTNAARTHVEALEFCKSPEIDIIIIDVYLNGNPDGIAFAETLNASPELSKPFL